MIIKLYRIDIELKPTKKSKLPESYTGAFVNVYLSAKDLISAITKAESSLEKDFYQVVSTIAGYELDIENNDYDTDEEGYPGNEKLKKILNSGDIIYGPLQCFSDPN